METSLTREAWSPYLAGAAIGVISWFAFWSADHPLGITSAFESTAAVVEKAAIPDIAGANDFYAQKESEGKPPKIGW